MPAAGGRWTTRSALVVALLAVAVHVLIGIALDGDALLPGDQAAYDLLAPLRSSAGADVVRVLTDVAAFPVAVVVVAISALYTGSRSGRSDRALGLVGGFVLLAVLIHVAKGAWDRPRPAGPLADAFGRSYPSGHAAYASAYVACALAAGGRRLLAVAVVVAVAVGVSRLYLHVHFLTDVVGGAALGIAVFALLLRP